MEGNERQTKPEYELELGKGKRDQARGTGRQMGRWGGRDERFIGVGASEEREKAIGKGRRLIAWLSERDTHSEINKYGRKNSRGG